MEINEFQDIWKAMDESISSQSKLNNHTIMEMTKDKYHSTINRISNKEKIGSIFCLLIVIFIIYTLKDQDTWYLMTCAILSMCFYIILPILSLKSIRDLNAISFASNNLRDTINEFHKKKTAFLKVQQLGILLGIFILFLFLPPTIKSIDGKDIFLDRGIWIWYIPTSLILLGLFARWGYNHYKRTIDKAEGILKDFQ
ncbi:MAG: hypothetical protein HKN68_19525 [Saprospiraceae bacterium]|nr:hypothetical protein [Saprospiraceae bacterium]